MRNILKPAARTASSRARRSVRGVAAVVASVALASGLGSYPVDAQETTASPASATQELAVPNAVTVERSGEIDHITIRDTDDNPWDSGRKASDEYIWGVKRIGDGDITRIVKVVADGEELDPQYFGYVNGEDFDVIGIDEDAFWTIPPMKLEIEVETTEVGEYAIAEPDEVPTARELSETGYGRTDNATATVNPGGVGMVRAANDTVWSNEVKLNSEIVGTGKQKFDKIGTEPYFEVRPAGELPNQVGPDIRITRIVVRNIEDRSGKADNEAEILKNEGVYEKYYFDDIKQVRDHNNRVKGFEVEFFDPETGDSPVSGEFIIHSGQDSLKIGVDGVDHWDEDLATLRQRYVVEVYGSFRVKNETSAPSSTAPTTPPTTAPNTPTTQASPTTAATSPNNPATNTGFVIAADPKTGTGVSISESSTAGSNPYITTAAFDDWTNFASAIVTVEAPNSVLSIESYSFNIGALEEGVTLGRKVISQSADRVVYEVYPVRNGSRVPSALVQKGSPVTMTSRFSDSPRNVKATALISGSKASAPAGSTTTLPVQPPAKPKLPIAPIVEKDVPPTQTGSVCPSGSPKPVAMKPRRELTPAEEDYGHRRFIVASPVSSGSRASSQLYLRAYGMDGNGSTNEPIGPKSAWVYNALAYNEKDNYLYAISQPRVGTKDGYKDDPCFPAGHLLQIDPYTGEVFDLGVVKGFQGSLPEDHSKKTANDLGSGINAGSFDGNGNYWVAGSSSFGSGRMYNVNLDTRVAETKSTLPDTYERKQHWDEHLKYRTTSEDFVVSQDSPGYMWGLPSGWSLKNYGLYLERVSLSGEEAVQIDISDLKVPNSDKTLREFLDMGPSDSSPVWGQAWIEPDGTFAFGKGSGSASDKNQAEVIRLRVTNQNGKPTGKNAISVKVVGTDVAPTSYNTDAAWAPAVQNPAPRANPVVEKQGIGNAIENPDGTYTVNYRIVVSADDKGRFVSYDNVIDTPAVPHEVTVLGAVWTQFDEFNRQIANGQSEGAGPFYLAPYGDIQPQNQQVLGLTSSGTHTFKISVRIRVNSPLNVENACATGPGLFNTVRVGNSSSVACVPPPSIEGDTTSLYLVKVDGDRPADLNDTRSTLKGAKFELVRTDQPQERVIDLNYDEQTGYFSAEGLESGSYRLTELTAPIGEDGMRYSLLVRPLVFNVRTEGSGTDIHTVISFDDDSQIMAKQVSGRDLPASWKLSASDAVITVANVRQGNLPKTGGMGVQLPILLGGALIAAGAYMGRRKVAA